MSDKKFKSADDEINYLRSKKQLTDEEFVVQDTLLSDQIEAATAALFAIPENQKRSTIPIGYVLATGV